MTAHTGPPGKRRGRPRGETGHPVADTLTDVEDIVPVGEDTTDDLTRELLELVDLLAIMRLRQMSADLSEAENWGQVANSIARSRVARNIRADGYHPLDRTPNPWPPESLDRNTWREGVV